MPGTLTLRAGSHSAEVRLDDDRTVVLNGVVYDVQPAGHDLYRVRSASGSWLVAAKKDGSTVWTSVNGHVAGIEPDRGGSTTKRGRSADDAGMRAPMPARVAKVLVDPGADVKDGEVVIVLEAMKMELPVRATRAGRVARLLCAPGQLVSAGAELLELE